MTTTKDGASADVAVTPPEESAQELDEAFDRLMTEGRTRLARPWSTLVTTGLVGGIDVGTGVLAYFVVENQTHSKLLAGIAFSIGFVALLLAGSELFTENFLVPVTAVVAGRSSTAALARLWLVTLLANLVGAWVMAWLIVTARPDLRATAIETGAHYAALGINLHSFTLAVLGGLVITLMTRMQHATESLGVKLVPAILFGSLLAGGQLFHSILDSLYMFAALHSGAPFGYLNWLGALGWSVLGNVVGGVVLVTFVRLVRVPGKVRAERERSPDT
jgi:formate/nitrite transporter FocA (FNT family)